MNITQLPNDTLRQIMCELDIKSQFNLAKTCKILYERVCALSLGRRFHIRNKTVVKGRFLIATTRAINLYLKINNIKYGQLKRNLFLFSKIKSLCIIIDRPISDRIASEVVHCIPTYSSPPLLLKVPRSSYSSFETAITESGRDDLVINI